MITHLNERLGLVFSYVYAVVAVLTFGEVCSRYFFNAPTQWTIEIVILLAAAHYLVAGPQAYASEGHIRIPVLYDRLPLPVRQALTVLERLVVATTCGLVGWWAVRQAQSALALNTYSPTILKVVLAIALGLFALQALAHLVRDRGRAHGG